KAQAASVVGQFLGTHGIDADTLASLHEVDRSTGRVPGHTQIHMEQRIAGLRVLDAYVKATVNTRGELVHLIENVAPVKGAAIAPPKASETQALKAALATLYPTLKTTSAVIGRQGNVTTFDKGTFFYSSPTVERVAYVTKSGILKTGFLVQTWSKSTNLLHHTLVDQSGKVQSVELRTNTDKYNIYPISPTATPQTIVAGPGIGNLESPSGWLFGGPQGSVNISGNNVHAYLDRNADNDPDSFGTRVTNGQFLTASDLTTFPTTAQNQNVAVQNLFYFKNRIHHTLEKHRFTEAAPQLQQKNSGVGDRAGGPPTHEDTEV